MARALLGLLVLMSVGCKSSSTEEPAPPPPAAADEAADEAADDAAGKVACHLNCSGQERTAYGANEEDARAAARQLVGELCNPDDGQFFIVCDPPAAE